jgi:hypothetical protein
MEDDPNDTLFPDESTPFMPMEEETAPPSSPMETMDMDDIERVLDAIHGPDLTISEAEWQAAREEWLESVAHHAYLQNIVAATMRMLQQQPNLVQRFLKRRRASESGAPTKKRRRLEWLSPWHGICHGCGDRNARLTCGEVLWCSRTCYETNA